MGAELAGEFEGLDEAFQLRLAPVPHGLGQLHRAIRDAGPVRAVVVQRVGKLHPAIFFSVLQCVPQFIVCHCRFSFFVLQFLFGSCSQTTASSCLDSGFLPENCLGVRHSPGHAPGRMVSQHLPFLPVLDGVIIILFSYYVNGFIVISAHSGILTSSRGSFTRGVFSI